MHANPFPISPNSETGKNPFYEINVGLIDVDEAAVNEFSRFLRFDVIALVPNERKEISIKIHQFSQQERP